MNDSYTKERQYQVLLEYRDKHGLESLGLMSSQCWYDDPKRLVFMLSRYKFVAKMLAGCERVLEIGCADAFGSRIVLQEVKELTAIDFDPLFVKDANLRMDTRWGFSCYVHDMLQEPVSGVFDGIYAIDVLEHILPENEDLFLKNALDSLSDHGTLIIGIPTLESQAFASQISKEGHVNCKTMPDLRNTMRRYFHNVFMFSLNDEVVHTGFHKMAHYVFALCCGKRVAA